MNVTMTDPAGAVFAVLPAESGDRAHVQGVACPVCGVEPFAIAGTGRRVESRDTYAADAICLACDAPVGVIRAQVETIFGLEEDERVLRHGRARVY